MENQVKGGTVFNQGSGWQKGKGRITYRLKDRDDNIFFLSILASGRDPFYRADTLRLTIEGEKQYLNGHLARTEEGIDLS